MSEPNARRTPTAGPAERHLLAWLRDTVLAWNPHRHPFWLRIAVALSITVFAAWMRMALAPAESGGRFITLSLAAAVCALYGGFRIGMVSTLVGMLLINFALVKPYFSFAIANPVEAFWLNLWHFLTQVVVVGAIALMQRQNRDLRESIALAERNQQQMLDTFERSATGMAHTWPDGTWIRVNQTYGDLIGYTREELLTKDWKEFTHPDDVEVDLNEMRRMIAGEIDGYTMEKRYIHRQGHEVWVVLSVSLIRLSDGQPDYMMVVVQDISERKTIEEALRRSDRLMRQAQQLVGMATWRYEASDRSFTMLSNSHEVLKLPSERFTEAEMMSYTHPDDMHRVSQAWADAIKGRRPYDIEYRLHFEDSWRWFSVRAEFERDANGRVTYGLGVVYDTSRRKENELRIENLNATLEQRVRDATHELKAAYDELESYSYAVAHDLRSPLRIINGFAQALEEDNPKLDADSVKHLKRIRDASKRMGELIDGLLKLSQLSRGELAREPIDISAIATQLLRELASDEPQRVVDWQVEPGLRAMADPPLIQGLMQNLLHNAWKYTAHKSEARIRVFARHLDDGRRQFCVSDNGAGFDMARAGKLFQPFQRLHLPSEFTGLGIGLATARRIVLRHGGELSAEAAPGQGAEFRFTLQAKS